MTARLPSASWRTLILALGALALLVPACAAPTGDTRTGDPRTDEADEAAPGTPGAVLRVGAIPDQEPQRLQRTYGLLADHLVDALGVEVVYVPVTDYQSAVTGFRVGDLDLVWFGGLTGVQARAEVPGAHAIAQRDIDSAFTSVFITRADTGIGPLGGVDDLAVVAGHSFTFGSESSTSGRLMPEYHLRRAGVDPGRDLAGAPGYSGSHDATIELVRAGTYEVGALNSQVWDARVAEGAVDPAEVVEILRTPPYADYHWVARPDLDGRFGAGFTDRVVAALTGLDPGDPEAAAILDLFGAGSFVEAHDDDYAAIEAVAREIGLVG